MRRRATGDSSLANRTASAGRLDGPYRNWYGLFKKLDTNNDGCITYSQMVQLIREEVRVPTSAVKDSVVQKVWKALDDDGDGLINAGEFGRFYRRAEMDREQKEMHNRREKVQAKAMRGHDRVAPHYVPEEERIPQTIAETRRTHMSVGGGPFSDKMNNMYMQNWHQASYPFVKDRHLKPWNAPEGIHAAEVRGQPARDRRR